MGTSIIRLGPAGSSENECGQVQFESWDGRVRRKSEFSRRKTIGTRRKPFGNLSRYCTTPSRANLPLEGITYPYWSKPQGTTATRKGPEMLNPYKVAYCLSSLSSKRKSSIGCEGVNKLARFLSVITVTEGRSEGKVVSG